MSDVSRGPGWWVAADGRWYAPDQHPDAAHRERWAAVEPPPAPEPAASDPPAGPGSAAPSTPSPSVGPPEPPAPTSATPPAVGPADRAGRGSRTSMVIGALLVAAVLIVGVVVVVTRGDGSTTATSAGGSGDASSDGETVVLEPLGSPGADPFATSMSVREVTDFPAEVRAVIGTTPAAPQPGDGAATVLRVGTEPGLYGGTGAADACDIEQLTTFLDGHAPHAEAWADALGLPGVDAIDGYADGLTPVVLTSDTLVTNNGFVDGRATPYPAVLQAGTAVLVDETGTPRVRCACGNPLAPAGDDVAVTTTSGTAWPGFDPNRVTVVQPGAATDSLVVVDVTTGQNRELGVGTNAAGGLGSGVVVGIFGDTYGGGSTIRASADGMEGTWEQVHRTDVILSGIGAGDDGFLAVGARLGSGSAGTDSSQVLRGSSDGRTWTEVGVIEGADVTDVAFTGGRWVAVGWTDYSTGQAATFESADGATWTPLATITRPEEFGGATGFDQVAADGDVLVAALRGNAGARSNPHALYRSTDGRTWSPTDAPIVDSPYLIGFGDGTWLAIGDDVLTSTDGSAWTSLGAPNGPASAGLVWDRGAWYTASFGEPIDPAAEMPALLHRSDDGITWVDITPPTFGGGDPTDFAVAS